MKVGRRASHRWKVAALAHSSAQSG